MGYKIRYGFDRKPNTGRSGRSLLLTFIFLILFWAAAYKLAPDQLAMLRQILFPQQQVDALLQALQEGASFPDAVTAFCQELLDGT